MTLVVSPPVDEDISLTPTRVPASRRRGKGKGWRPKLVHLLLLPIALITAFPFWAMIAIAIQPPGTPIRLPDALFPTSISLDAFAQVFRGSEIGRWALNSTIYSLVSVVLVILIAAMAGYAFAKMRFRGKEFAFWTILAMMMVPAQLTLIPRFILVSEMNGLDSMWGLIVPTLASVQALFLMRQFIQDIPDEMLEAARIDGASEFRTFWSIVLPQTKPILATLGTFVFLWHWNDFLWPLVVGRSPSSYVLTVGLNSMRGQETSLAVIMAAAVALFVPTLIVFLLLQRYFVRGVMMSGMK